MIFSVLFTNFCQTKILFFMQCNQIAKLKEIADQKSTVTNKGNRIIEKNNHN